MKVRKKIIVMSMLLFGLMPASGAAAADSGSSEQKNVDPALTQTVTSDEQVAPAGNPVELYAGHIDMGPLLTDGKWGLFARDDTGKTPIWRNPDEIVYRVSDAAKQQIPANEEYKFIKAEAPVWVIPQQELRGAVWRGWNTQSPEVVNQVNGGVDLIFEGHQGPGDFHVFIQAGNFAGPQQLWNSTQKKAQPIHVELNTHTHANWVFTEPGVHLVRVTAQAQLKNGETVSDTKILRFAVSDTANAQQALNETWNIENFSASEIKDSHPSALDQNTALPFIVGGIIIAAAILVLGTVFVLRKNSEKAKSAGESLAAAASGKTVDVTTETAGESNRNE